MDPNSRQQKVCNVLTSKENEKNVNEMIIDDNKTILHHFI